MAVWLMKSEPSEYAITDLERDGQSSWYWVRNYQARNFLRDKVRDRDIVLFYHSSCAEPGIYGLARVIGWPHPDETQYEVGGDSYDPKATRERPIWYAVTVEHQQTLREPLLLSMLRSIEGLSTMRILSRGNRLSVTPVTEDEYRTLLPLLH